MTRMLGRQRRTFLLAVLLVLLVLLVAAGSAQALGLKAGAHGRANIADPGRSTPIVPQITPNGFAAGGTPAGLAGLAVVLSLVGAAGRTGWQGGGREDAPAWQLSAVSAAPRDDKRQKDDDRGRKAA
jgi:hypothetical protein